MESVFVHGIRNAMCWNRGEKTFSSAQYWQHIGIKSRCLNSIFHRHIGKGKPKSNIIRPAKLRNSIFHKNS